MLTLYRITCAASSFLWFLAMCFSALVVFADGRTLLREGVSGFSLIGFLVFLTALYVSRRVFGEEWRDMEEAFSS